MGKSNGNGKGKEEINGTKKRKRASDVFNEDEGGDGEVAEGMSKSDEKKKKKKSKKSKESA